MKIGLIARSEDRGLGVMTHAFFRHMDPAKVMLIAPAPNIARGFAQHYERYRGHGDAWFMPWDGGHLTEGSVRAFLTGLDVLYSAETFYDPRIPEIAAEMGVATVLHSMPEFYNCELPQPTRTWLPTTWRADQFDDPVIMPVPVEPADVAKPPSTTLRVLHVAGHRAMSDRNGTLTFMQALRLMRGAITATIACQDRRLPSVRPVGPRVRLVQRIGGFESMLPVYDETDVLVMPRRYGGLCLPVQEALARGNAVIMPDVSPNRDWPVMLVPAEYAPGQVIVTAAGEIPCATVQPGALARTIDALADDSAQIDDLQQQARAWASDNSWAMMRPRYESALEDARDAL